MQKIIVADVTRSVGEGECSIQANPGVFIFDFISDLTLVCPDILQSGFQEIGSEIGLSE